MSIAWNRRVAAALVLGAGLALAPAAAPPADAATITACVKKKTGALRLRSGAKAKRKCPKGWSKLRWNTTGPAGKQGAPGAPGAPGLQGPAGPQLQVKDKNGAVVGTYLSVLPFELGLLSVERDGGWYTYFPSGQLFAPASPNWTTNDCSGTAYLPSSGPAYFKQVLPALAGGPFRVVFRATDPLGPASAWKVNGGIQAVSATQLYRRNSTTGNCETGGPPFTGDLFFLDATPAPPDFAGPLTIG